VLRTQDLGLYGRADLRTGKCKSWCPPTISSGHNQYVCIDVYGVIRT